MEVGSEGICTYKPGEKPCRKECNFQKKAVSDPTVIKFVYTSVDESDCSQKPWAGVGPDDYDPPVHHKWVNYSECDDDQQCNIDDDTFYNAHPTGRPLRNPGFRTSGEPPSAKRPPRTIHDLNICGRGLHGQQGGALNCWSDSPRSGGMHLYEINDITVSVNGTCS